MKKQLSKYYILLLLAIMFAAPGISAYIFYHNPSWLGASKINKGTLLSPPVVLKTLDDQSKWRIVFWNPGVCEQACLKKLNMLSRIRQALGRRLYNVDQWLILGDKVSSISDNVKVILKEQDFHVAELSPDEMSKLVTTASEPQIFIANPDNYLILSYKAQANPDDIYKDLKLLLNTAELKSG